MVHEGLNLRLTGTNIKGELLGAVGESRREKQGALVQCGQAGKASWRQ